MNKKIIATTLLVALWTTSLFTTTNAFNMDNACTLEYSPVIWTDWKTYWNKCFAKKAWVYREYQVIDDSKFDLWKACTLEYMPIKWIDGKTYPNKCAAKQAGAYHEDMDDNLDVDDIVFDNEKLLNTYLDFNIPMPMPEINKEVFLKKYGKQCISASDGTNRLMIKDWKIIGWTKIASHPYQKPQYTCLVFKDLEITEELEDKFDMAVEFLSLEDIKKANEALTKYFNSWKKETFEKSFEKATKLVKRIEKIETKKLSERNIHLLTYLKYQTMELFDYE